MLASCSGGKGSFNPVKGTVLYKDAPASGVVVTLLRVGANDIGYQPSTGQTGDDGTFEIVTGQDDGVPEGEYIVTCAWLTDASSKAKKPGTISMSPELSMVDKLKGRYSNRKKPELPNVTIKKGVNQLEPFRLQ
jgi:hypothetical protein